MELLKEVDMGKMIPFDTLAYAKKLESRGIEVSHAEAHAEVLAEVLENSFYTKQDTAMAIEKLSQKMDSFQAETRTEFAAVRSEMSTEFAAVRSEMSTEFAAVHSEMNTGFAAIRSEMSTEFSVIRGEFGNLKWDIIKWVLIIFFAQTAFILSIMKFFH